MKKVTMKVNGRVVEVWVFTDSIGVPLPVSTRSWRWSTYPNAGKRSEA